MKIKKMVVGLLAGTFLLSIMASPQAVRIGSFADVRNNMVRVLNRRVTYYKDIDPLPYTRLKVGYFKKILEFCYYYRAQLPGFPIIYLRWAVRDVIEDICREWYNGLLFIGPTNDPMVGFDHRAIFDVDSFDELLYNLGIMYIVYMGFSEKLEEGHQLCEAQKSLGSAVDPSMAIQEAESDERVCRLLRCLAYYFECMPVYQRSKFKDPTHLLTDMKGIPPLGNQAPSERFAPIFTSRCYEETCTINALERSCSTPCADSLFAKKEDGEYEEKACGMPIRSKSAPSESDSSGGDSINAFMGELLLRETHYRHVPTGRAKVSTDWSPPSGGVDSTGPLVFGTTSDKKDDK